VAQAQVAGDEPGPVQADRGPVIERGAAEDFQGVTGWILGAQHRAHPARGELGFGGRLVRDAGVGQGAADRGQRLGVTHLPAGGEEAVG